LIDVDHCQPDDSALRCIEFIAMSAAMAEQALIWASLEAASRRCDDLVPLVYERLFAAHPEVVEIFAVGPGEAPNPAMGGMINELIALIGDGIDNGHLDSTIMSTLINHGGWGIDLAMYRTLLDGLIDSVREACGEAWSGAMAAAWQRRSALIMDSLQRNQAEFERQRAAAISSESR
jgi:hemoglobin-like flavoprotein